MNSKEQYKTGYKNTSIYNLRLISYTVLQYKLRIFLSFCSVLIVSLSTLLLPYIFKKVIDNGFNSEKTKHIVDSSFYDLLVIVAFLSIATAYRYYSVSWLGERVVADIRRKVQAHLLRLTPQFFEKNRPSEIASRMTSDTAIIEQAIGTTASIALRSVFTGIGGIIYLFLLSPKLAAYLLLVIPTIIVPVLMLGRRLQALSRSSQDKVAEVASVISEEMTHLRTVQGFNQEDREEIHFKILVENTFFASRQRFIVGSILGGVMTSLTLGAITVLLWAGASDVAAGTITGGTIAAFVLTAGVVANAFGALTEVYASLLRGAGAAARLAELLAEKSPIDTPVSPQLLPAPARGILCFDRVGFHYPTQPDAPVICDFSLTISHGETVAIVGPSGAGKSTLFQLAQRFYDPQVGEVRIDGVALTQADPAAVRQRIAIVPQDTVIFATSVRDNLRYGRWDANDSEIWAAADTANAMEFLRDLPQGLDTFLGEGGTRLSGGQRQRIAIARAILRDAPILLLDEATSALDSENERVVQVALSQLMAHRTTIVIAHRLATVRSADRIIVMDRGRIVEEGRHNELIARGGLYARLARHQFDREIIPNNDSSHEFS